MIISDLVTNFYLFIQNYRLEIIVTEDLNNDCLNVNNHTILLLQTSTCGCKTPCTRAKISKRIPNSYVLLTIIKEK